MKALVWHGTKSISVDNVPDPTIQEPDDCVIKVTSTAICGSDLHLFDGYQPTMEDGDILGHEPMGEVVAVGRDVKKLKVGDRVVVPFTISCGHCFFCNRKEYSMCDETNPNHAMAEKMMGHSPAGLFGFSHLLGGFPGGQAQYLRVPKADVGPQVVRSGLKDEQVLFLSDIFPTGYMAAENTQLEKGDTVAVWGCGPVGQFAIQSLWMLGAGRVIAIDCVPERLDMARRLGKAETINFMEQDVNEVLNQMTKGRGPDRCIDAVGAEAHGMGGVDAIVDKVKAAVMLTTDRTHALRQAIFNCRKGGTVSVPGVYVGFPDKFPMGAVMNKGLTIKTGQTHVQRYTQPLLDRIESGQIDPSLIVTHVRPLEDGPEMYETFRDKKDNCIKVVLKPWN